MGNVEETTYPCSSHLLSRCALVQRGSHLTTQAAHHAMQLDGPHIVTTFDTKTLKATRWALTTYFYFYFYFYIAEAVAVAVAVRSRPVTGQFDVVKGRCVPVAFRLIGKNAISMVLF